MEELSSLRAQGTDLLGGLFARGLQLLFPGLGLAAFFVAAQDLVDQIRRTVVAGGQALPDGIGIFADGADVDHGNAGGIRTMKPREFTRKL